MDAIPTSLDDESTLVYSIQVLRAIHTIKHFQSPDHPHHLDNPDRDSQNRQDIPDHPEYSYLTITGTTIPGTTIPGTTIKGATTPGTTIAGLTIAESTIDEITVRSTAGGTTIAATVVDGITISKILINGVVIDEVIDGSTIPGTIIPGSTVLGNTIYATSIPGTTITGTTIVGTILAITPSTFDGIATETTTADRTTIGEVITSGSNIDLSTFTGTIVDRTTTSGNIAETTITGTTPPAGATSESTLPVSTIAGMVGGIIGALLMGAFGTYLLMRRRKMRKSLRIPHSTSIQGIPDGQLYVRASMNVRHELDEQRNPSEMPSWDEHNPQGPNKPMAWEMQGTYRFTRWELPA